jgi:hypothetical protein
LRSHSADSEESASDAGRQSLTMVNKVLLTTAFFNVLVLASGVLILTTSLVIRSQMNRTTTDGPSALRNLIFVRLPLDAGIANGVFILITSVLSLPGILMQSTRGWLKLTGYMVTVCGLFTMCLGVYLWIMTLKIGEGFQQVYEELEPDIQSLIQSDVSNHFWNRHCAARLMAHA